MLVALRHGQHLASGGRGDRSCSLLTHPATDPSARHFHCQKIARLIKRHCKAARRKMIDKRTNSSNIGHQCSEWQPWRQGACLQRCSMIEPTGFGAQDAPSRRPARQALWSGAKSGMPGGRAPRTAEKTGRPARGRPRQGTGIRRNRPGLPAPPRDRPPGWHRPLRPTF